ncbi:MAG: flagellar FliJ family protein [Armatimonadota bacterium]|nr:flagellar FliJ family protein [Armatimonadota bacterium]MDW8155956.1 flagellar FliJ family protein [Armatimonadota bacterium]
MRRFRFRLQGLLRLRRLREREGRRELAEALRSLRQAEARCEAARQALRQAEARVVQGRDAQELRWWADAVEACRQQLARAEAVRAEAARRADELWARFLQLRRDRKVVERVRDRRWKLHQREQARREQAQLDELALLRRGRQG